jgi:integrase
MDIILEAKSLRPSRCPVVFPNRHGKPYHHGGGFDKTWRLIRKKAGLSHIRFHDLRHTFASWLASSGKVDIYTLKELLGHSDIEMTQRYAHLINGALLKAVNVADEVFR